MPIPVSMTLIWIACLPASNAMSRVTVPEAGVNLMALSTRLIRTWWIRSRSPR
ncbi:hypothetical protein D3C87_2116040 [compost metagenome]